MTGPRLHKIGSEVEKDEAWLQRYIAAHPEILPLGDLEGIGSHLRLIARELLDIDLLLVDERGLLTIVETKLYKNPEARRQVIAQVLDYASKIRDIRVNELCSLVASTANTQAVTEIQGLNEFVSAMSSPRGNASVDDLDAIRRVILAHYVVTGKVSPVPNLSAQEKTFLTRLDIMLREESLRLVIVMDKAPGDFFDLLNYTASISRRGTQLVGVEMTIEPLGTERYFVPHLIGTSNRLSSEYYREEKTADRIIQGWDTERYLAQLPEDLRGELSRIISRIKEEDGRLTQEFGKGRTGALLLGVRLEKIGRTNNLIEIKADGKVRIYGSLASTGLTGPQKDALVSIVAKRPYLRDAAHVIEEGSRTKKYGAEPEVRIEAFGRGDAMIENIVSLLQDYDGLVNP